MPAYAAYNCRFEFGTAPKKLRASSVNISWKIDALDVTCMDQGTLTNHDNGQETFINGVEGAEISVDAFWFSEDNPFANDGANIGPGVVLTSVKIYPTKTILGGSYWDIPYLFIESVDSTMQVRDAIRYQFRGKVSQKNLVPFASV